MPSPFPGMDPYLEHPAIWPDVHLELIRASRAALAPKVAPRYYVAVEERTYLVASDPHTFLGRPDVAVVGAPPLASSPGAASSAVLERPITVELPIPDEVCERYLEVRETATHEVVTVIEILSPSNKHPGEGREQYERKRRKVLGSLTSLVEFDLLRDGPPMPMGPLPSSHYRVLVSREWERYNAQLYPFNLDESIPEIPIPLRRGEPEPTLAMGDLIAHIYDQVRYDLRLDYTREPRPPLAPADAAWSNDLLALTSRNKQRIE